MDDLYDNGTPKYSTAQDIYDALCELMMMEEASILGEMFENVSYDGQEYYYTDKGDALKERFEKMSDYGNKMWLLDLAIWQIDDGEIHELIYQALNEPDLAKRLGFKKIFVEQILLGDKTNYEEITEAYCEEANELRIFDYWEMTRALDRVMEERGRYLHVSLYNNLCDDLMQKARNLQLHNEKQLIIECRALLTSYDDFILGLRMNQTLYTELEQRYQAKTAALKAGYTEAVKYLLTAAQEQGIAFELPEAAKALAGE